MQLTIDDVALSAKETAEYFQRTDPALLEAVAEALENKIAVLCRKKEKLEDRVDFFRKLARSTIKIFGDFAVHLENAGEENRATIYSVIGADVSLMGSISKVDGKFCARFIDYSTDRGDIAPVGEPQDTYEAAERLLEEKIVSLTRLT